MGWGNKSLIKGLGHMTKVAAMPIYGKPIKIIFSGTKRPITLKQHQVLECYQICSNDDPGLTLTYFRARSNLVPYAFIREKGKPMDVSEIIVVYDVDVSRCSYLNEYMNLYEYHRARSFIDLGPKSLRFNIFNLLYLRNR